MDSNTTCRIQVKWPRSEGSDEHVIRSLSDIKDSPDSMEKLKQQWIDGIVKSFNSNSNQVTTIRPWDILLHQDGSVELLSSEKENSRCYPSRYRIPSQHLLGLDEREKVRRAERFALGSLIYEIVTEKQPFPELGSNEVQDRYRSGEFPDDVFSMAMGPFILACWCVDFEEELKKYLPSVGDRLRTYAKAHPYLLASSALAMTASVAAIPVLGLVGFAATGPVASSAAAAWQSSLGVVQAGSLFAWCQSAAMGGSAVNGIIALGAAGGGVASAAAGRAIVSRQGDLTPEKLKELFLAVYLKRSESDIGRA